MALLRARTDYSASRHPIAVLTVGDAASNNRLLDWAAPYTSCTLSRDELHSSHTTEYTVGIRRTVAQHLTC